MEKIYYKLVRDNIPEIIESDGEIPIYRELNDEEYWAYLLKKDQEELLEVALASTKEEIKKELADKYELIRTMAEYLGFGIGDIVEEANNKKRKNGGFKKRIFLEKTIKK